MKIKKGDKVKVLTGSDKGKSGVVLRAMPKADQVLVEGVNIKHKNKKATRKGEKGTVVDVAFPINVSNVKKV